MTQTIQTLILCAIVVSGLPIAAGLTYLYNREIISGHVTVALLMVTFLAGTGLIVWVTS